jgi:L-lactate dehydrogenase complex protein LldF
MRSPRRWTSALRALRVGRLVRGRRALPPPLSAWTRARDLPVPPKQTLRDWWREQ